MTLQKRYEGRYEIAGTHVYARAYQDPDGTHVYCVIEEGSGSRVLLEQNRDAVTERLAQSMGRTPDEVRWLEQSRDGTLREYRSHPVDRGQRPPIRYQVTEPRPVSDSRLRSLEYQIGGKIETHAQQLAREWREQRRAMNPVVYPER